MRSKNEFFFFRFYVKYLIFIVAISPGVVPILDFWIFRFLKNIFGKMQSRAGGGRPNEEEYACFEGYCLFRRTRGTPRHGIRN